MSRSQRSNSPLPGRIGPTRRLPIGEAACCLPVMPHTRIRRSAGQGLNLGLGDAMNLGWKLAATIRGDAPPGLLDSYAQEREPVGASILDWSRAQVALMRPEPAARALGAIVRDLIETRDGATYFAERVWGIGLRYDLGADHALVGRAAPDFELVDGTRLNERLRTGRVCCSTSMDARACESSLMGGGSRRLRRWRREGASGRERIAGAPRWLRGLGHGSGRGRGRRCASPAQVVRTASGSACVAPRPYTATQARFALPFRSRWSRTGGKRTVAPGAPPGRADATGLKVRRSKDAERQRGDAGWHNNERVTASVTCSPALGGHLRATHARDISKSMRIIRLRSRRSSGFRRKISSASSTSRAL